MRPSPRCLQALQDGALRAKSTSFIGLGRMGYEMAFNLFSKQHAQANDTRFIVCDAVRESAERFCQSFRTQHPGARIEVAGTPKDATLASSVIVTMLPSSPQVNSVYHEGIMPGLINLSTEAVQGTLCIDSTTLDVSVAREVAKDVTKLGARMVDAPVSGGVTGAKAGTLSFLVGGTEESFKLAQPYLSLMGQRLIYCGSSGAGLGAKICNNLVLGVQQIVIGEAMLLGQKMGLEPSVLAGVINSSTGACWASSVNNPVPTALKDKSPPCDRDYEGGFATALMLKDMGLATGIAQEEGSPLPLGEAAERLYHQVASSPGGLARKDFSSVYLYLKEAMQAGRKVTA
ncbi:hypothetical protein AMATHDRAFT_63843 [Amanita thiersii Skay4041]|uniref:3-hydroxyisobutyrate dehydrogenase n=1 Tax=Amanita thiersii Skay4041 TaxID=703135 RepID=A0A2A9NN15_9AGAR|nr:hypothetical protein AMATHDRAFT_63843 [Amanita thiersii Skay4041]